MQSKLIPLSASIILMAIVFVSATGAFGAVLV